VLELAYGETGSADEAAAAGALSITFQAVLEDSRCPLNVQCAWSGRVRVQLGVQAGNEPAKPTPVASLVAEGSPPATEEAIADPLPQLPDHRRIYRRG
jgi:hypothetical protein